MDGYARHWSAIAFLWKKDATKADRLLVIVRDYIRGKTYELLLVERNQKYETPQLALCNVRAQPVVLFL